MKIFEHPNLNGFICPICKTSDDKPITLIGIDGTQKDRIIQANQYHVECIDLIEITGDGIKIISQGIYP